ncbi:FlhB domain-containing protein [Catenovulum agarivorans DS-2]|uniref:Flagellar biosynthetic protein FlhB n=1 Tax=Catenovulum agarivorans DS-2 TaxID=1328313 RepID=W7R3K4_9ALTE|nr:EscU/YscU/HrcU family type III secretion system export apparatus switch protein [Catenovulum agarivorans]EWH12205.1 FlhB domain-containing protein [Catenovulum agarivorans DS-2]
MSNDEKKAVALTYDAPNTPKVTAKGFDELAQSIIQQAQEAGVMVHEDIELANYLAKLDVGSEIPEDVYIIIAEIIAWSYLLKGITPADLGLAQKRINTQA